MLRGLHETGVEIGETVTVIGAGTIGLMFMQVAKLMGCNVIAVVKRDEQVAAAKKAGAHEVVQITKVSDPVEAVRELTPKRRGSEWPSSAWAVRSVGPAPRFRPSARSRSRWSEFRHDGAERGRLRQRDRTRHDGIRPSPHASIGVR